MSWSFSIRILTHKPDGIVICMEDEMLRNGSYHTQAAYKLVKGEVEGLLKADNMTMPRNDCPDFAWPPQSGKPLPPTVPPPSPPPPMPSKTP
jgi:hypothetical protein